MKISILALFLVLSCTLNQKTFEPSKAEVEQAEKIAIEVADWFEYTTGPMKNERLGQCGDYAVKFILDYNKFAGKDVARLVVANNPVDSGTYRIGKKVDVKALGFNGFSSGSSGFLSWNGQLYLYHPVLGAYEIFLEKAWTPTKHFGVNMLDKRQVHVWASVGNLSVDPTYYDIFKKNFPSPLGKDE